ncbi:MAG: hypothetical protein DSM107014_06765 [Gomphosphaeria aponina SAG 52.96 = DSM 107014]|uniref:Uncharacterized protein n=1 Tax=Gomphosphaeria aponina SAG 52.96 = DSM 107014 TaxID=1521640 RepID=A0A941GQC0_9CHRO|nr:hypothetical protein [Gomphosphaeria aponina SAG 52.96 = DSM 107014]
MNNRRPEFYLENQSVISVVTELHSYFRDLQSYYKVAHGELIDQLDLTQDEAKTEELKQKLGEVNQKIDFFHVLNNAISIADTVLHNEAMIDEFRDDK